jgi:hypothetical protein
MVGCARQPATTTTASAAIGAVLDGNDDDQSILVQSNALVLMPVR